MGARRWRSKSSPPLSPPPTSSPVTPGLRRACTRAVRRRDSGVRPDVNRYLKWAFIETANAICLTRRRRPSRHVSRLYKSIFHRNDHPKALGAVARHLAKATFGILSKQEPYREPKVSTGNPVWCNKRIGRAENRIRLEIQLEPRITYAETLDTLSIVGHGTQVVW